MGGTAISRTDCVAEPACSQRRVDPTQINLCLHCTGEMKHPSKGQARNLSQSAMERLRYDTSQITNYHPD